MIKDVYIKCLIREREGSLSTQRWPLNHLFPAESKSEAAWQVKEKSREGKELRTPKEMARFWGGVNGVRRRRCVLHPSLSIKDQYRYSILMPTAIWNYSVFTHLEFLKMVTFMVVPKKIIVRGVRPAIGPAFVPSTGKKQSLQSKHWNWGAQK